MNQIRAVLYVMLSMFLWFTLLACSDDKVEREAEAKRALSNETDIRKPKVVDVSTLTESPANAGSGPDAGLEDPHKSLNPSLGKTTSFAQFKVGNRNVKAILADGPIVWVGTSGGVIRYDTRTADYQLFDVRSGLLSNGVFHLSKYKGKLVVGTYGGGLSLYDPDSGDWANYNIQHGLADSFVYDVEVMDNGDIWIATWSGANRVRGGALGDLEKWDTFTVENTSGGLPNDWVYGLAKGKNGELWLSTEGGLARYENGLWANWQHEDGLGEVYEKVKEQIKFGRDPARESSHHARQKVEMGLTNVDIAYNPNYTLALYVDVDGVVWVGTWGAGLARFDGENWKNYTVSNGLPDNHVYMLGPGKDGKIWVGTGSGLALFDGRKFKVYTVHDGLIANNVFSMANAEDGSLWLGSFGGVTRFMKID